MIRGEGPWGRSSIQAGAWARAVETVAAETAGCRRRRLAEERIEEAGWLRLMLLL